MKVIKAFGFHDLRIIDVPIPSVKPNEVLVKVKACGICGSDKWCWETKEPAEHIAGHEVAGEVVDVGDNVKSIKNGDAVAINNVKGCGVCEACIQGNYVSCQEDIIHMSHGFSEYVAVPERNCLILSKNISYEEGSLIFDNWGTPYNAVERAHIKKNDYVVICGCGPIGIAAIRLSKLKEAKVIAIDPVAFRRDFAVSMGADLVLDPYSASLNKTIKDLTNGKGVCVFIECSGKEQSYHLAFDILKKGGKLISVGEGVHLTLNLSDDIIHKQISMIGSFYSTMEQGEYVQQLLLDGLIDPIKLVTHRFTFEELPKKFGEIFNNSEGILKTILIP